MLKNPIYGVLLLPPLPVPLELPELLPASRTISSA